MIDVDQRFEATPESSALLLPRLGTVALLASGLETPVAGTRPAGITNESILQMSALLGLLAVVSITIYAQVQKDDT